MDIIRDVKFEYGYFSANESIILFRGMKRKNLHSMDQGWEAWVKHEEEVIAYKTIFKRKKLRIIVICFFEKDDGPIKYWDFGPENCMDGFQSKPEGKYTRRLRRWFLDEFGIVLPQAGPWGKIDACHDPHNQTTSVFCAYQ